MRPETTPVANHCPSCGAPFEALLDDLQLCRACNLLRFDEESDVADHLNELRARIRSCFCEDTRRGERTGRGSVSSGARRKPKAGEMAGRRDRMRDHGLSDYGPVGRPDPKERAIEGLTRAASSTVSFRVDDAGKERLSRLAEKYGGTGGAVRAALEALEMLEAAKPSR